MNCARSNGTCGRPLTGGITSRAPRTSMLTGPSRRQSMRLAVSRRYNSFSAIPARNPTEMRSTAVVLYASMRRSVVTRRARASRTSSRADSSTYAPAAVSCAAAGTFRAAASAVHVSTATNSTRMMTLRRPGSALVLPGAMKGPCKHVVTRLLAAALLVLLPACNTVDDIRERLRGETPREDYVHALASAGLLETALAKDWVAAAEAALHRPLAAEVSVEETGYLDPAEPHAV